jgi:hypothetical protein
LSNVSQRIFGLLFVGICTPLMVMCRVLAYSTGSAVKSVAEYLCLDLVLVGCQLSSYVVHLSLGLSSESQYLTLCVCRYLRVRMLTFVESGVAMSSA